MKKLDFTLPEMTPEEIDRALIWARRTNDPDIVFALEFARYCVKEHFGIEFTLSDEEVLEV